MVSFLFYFLFFIHSQPSQDEWAATFCQEFVFMKNISRYRSICDYDSERFTTS